MADIRYVITVDEKGETKKIETFDKAVKDLEKSAESTTAAGKTFASEFMGKLVPAFAVATLAADAVRGALRGVKNAITDTIGAAIAQEEAERGLSAALELTGRTVAGNLEHYKQFAAAQQKATTYGDEQIMMTQALLLQMTKLDQQGVDRATRGILGLASALHMDLNAATVLVQKAMAGQFQTLSRYGIVLDENLSVEEKRIALLEKLDVLYGRAQAETQTYAGALKVLKNAWGDAQEEIGNALVKNAQVKDLIQTVTRVIREMTPEIKDYIEGVAAFIGAIAKVTEAALKAIEEVRRKMGGMRSDVTESERAWDKLGQKLGGFSGVVQRVNSAILTLGQYSEQSRALVETMGERLWASFNEIGERATLAAIAEGKFGEEAQKALEVVGGESLKLAVKLAEVGAKVNEVGDEVGEVSKSLRTLNGDIERNFQYWQGWGMNVSAAINDVGGSLGSIVGGELGRAIDFSEKKADGLFENLVTGSTGAGRSIKRSVQEWAGDFQEKMAAVQQYASLAFGAMDAVISQAQTNRQIEIDNEYKRRLDAINKSVMAEEEKQKAIEALEADYQIKQSSAKRAAAKQSKAVALMGAIVNTADAVAKALTAGPFIGPILAGIIGAMGAIQISLITKQPIPLAKGGFFDRPTLLPAAERSYLAGEAGAEVLSPVPMLRRIVREESRAGDVQIECTVQIYAQTLDDRTVERIGPKLGRVLNDQLRIHGRGPLWQT